MLTSVKLNCILPNSALKSLSQHACIWRKGMSGGDKFKYHKNGVLYNRNGGLIRGRRDIRALSLFLVRTWREGGYLQTGKRTLTRNWTPPESEFPATRNVRRYISLFNLSSLLYLQPEQTKTTSNTMCLFFFLISSVVALILLISNKGDEYSFELTVSLYYFSSLLSTFNIKFTMS